MTLVQLRVLALIARSESGRCDQAEVGPAVGISRAGASKVVDHLVRQQYLQRGIHYADRRRRVLMITRRGRNVLSRTADSLTAAGRSPGTPTESITP